MPARPTATLTISVVINGTNIGDILDFSREVVEKAREQGQVTGTLKLHTPTPKIDVRQL